MRTFEPVLPFLRAIRLSQEAEEKRQKLIAKGVLAKDADIATWLFTF